MASRPPATVCSGPSSGGRFAAPSASGPPHTAWAFSGMKRVGSQPSAISAVIRTLAGPSEAM